MLSNIRHDIDSIISKAIYHDVIESHLYNSSLVGAKSFIHLKKENFNKQLKLVRLPRVFSLVGASILNFFSINKFICIVILFAI